MKKWTIQFALALCALLSAGASAWAQPVSIGIIDEDKLASGYTRYREALVRLDREAQESDAKLLAREMLDGDQAKRFDALIVKEERKAAEATELENLVKAGNARRAEQLGLMGKVNPTEADRKRLDELNGLSQINVTALRVLQENIFEVVNARQKKIDQENTDRANTVIQQVAADKKLALIWRKRAIIWSAPSVDVTDEVLARLNKK
jgi:Skp family chaperone for outer membrane proteins